MKCSAGESSPKAAAVADLIVEVFRLNGRLLAAGDKLVADIGLSSALWQVMGAIALAAAPLPVAHIARNMGLTRQSVQRIVGELEAEGLLRLAPNPHHQRAKLVLLTARGETAFRAAMARQVPWAEALASPLRQTEIESTSAVLRALGQRAEALPSRT